MMLMLTSDDGDPIASAPVDEDKPLAEALAEAAETIHDDVTEHDNEV